MISRRIVVMATLLLGACSKSEPSTSTTASGSPTRTAATATGEPSQVQTRLTSMTANDDHGGRMMPGMPSGMPMQHQHDGGHPMADLPMPAHQ